MPRDKSMHENPEHSKTSEKLNGRNIPDMRQARGRSQKQERMETRTKREAQSRDHEHE